jgi:uncharacterized protein YrrD
MRVRFTASIGIPVREQHGGRVLGFVRGILIHPDTGAIEAFIVRSSGIIGSGDLVLLPIDILHWGATVTVRDDDVLAMPDDIIRLQSVLDGNRPVLGARIRTRSGKSLGCCRDIQFSTQFYRLEWIFPRKLFRWGQPIAAQNIVEVRTDGIVVKDVDEPVQVDVPIIATPETA